jgi:hypothetical protein
LAHHRHRKECRLAGCTIYAGIALVMASVRYTALLTILKRIAFKGC